MSISGSLAIPFGIDEELAAEPMDAAVTCSTYLDFSREHWSHLRDTTPLPLSEAELLSLKGINDELSLEEVEAIYLPLSRLLNLHIVASQGLHRVTDQFLGTSDHPCPYIIGVAGSVAAGKSTTARLLQALLSRWPDHPRVDLVTTDGFLYPNRVLASRGLMHRKGFPESYDVRSLIRFVADLKSGHPRVEAPLYSHLIYDVVPSATQVVEQPDIVIIEGLNVLQSSRDYPDHPPQVFVSDFFDFSIYVDASDDLLENWYIERFIKLRQTAFRDASSYFRRYAEVSELEARGIAARIWREINRVNLQRNIAPTRERAYLILEKGQGHSVERVRLRRL